MWHPLGSLLVALESSEQVTTGHTLRELDPCPSHVSHISPFIFIIGATSGILRCSTKVKRYSAILMSSGVAYCQTCILSTLPDDSTLISIGQTGRHVALNIMLHGWKEKFSTTQLQGWAFKMKWLRPSASTLWFKGRTIKAKKAKTARHPTDWNSTAENCVLTQPKKMHTVSGRASHVKCNVCARLYVTYSL